MNTTQTEHEASLDLLREVCDTIEDAKLALPFNIDTHAEPLMLSVYAEDFHAYLLAFAGGPPTTHRLPSTSVEMLTTAVLVNGSVRVRTFDHPVAVPA